MLSVPFIIKRMGIVVGVFIMSMISPITPVTAYPSEAATTQSYMEASGPRMTVVFRSMRDFIDLESLMLKYLQSQQKLDSLRGLVGNTLESQNYVTDDNLINMLKNGVINASDVAIDIVDSIVEHIKTPLAPQVAQTCTVRVVAQRGVNLLMFPHRESHTHNPYSGASTGAIMPILGRTGNSRIEDEYILVEYGNPPVKLWIAYAGNDGRELVQFVEPYCSLDKVPIIIGLERIRG